MNKISKLLRKLLFQRKPPTFKRKNGSNQQFRKKMIIFGGLCAGVLFFGWEIKNWMQVLLAGESAGYVMKMYFNRHNEIYVDGIVLFIVMGLCLSALYLYSKDAVGCVDE